MTNESVDILLEKYTEWLSLTEEEREEQGLPKDQKSFSVAHGVSQPTLSRWAAQLKEANPDQVQKDADVSLLQRKLKKEALKGTNPKYAELWARSLGVYAEKKEEKQEIELGANDYYIIAERVIQSIRDNIQKFGGACPVCHKSSLLPQPVCVDNKQEHSQSS